MRDLIWKPSEERIQKTKVFEFIGLVNSKYGTDLKTFEQLHEFSIQRQSDFWDLAYDYFKVIGDKGSIIRQEGDHFHTTTFFPEAKVNFAENLLRGAGPDEAIVFWTEQRERKVTSFDSLRSQSLAFATALKAAGVSAGDRIAAFVPNIPETTMAMIGTSAVGGIWSSCSPDFGVAGVLDRFSQIEPKVFVSTDGYYYGGKMHSNMDKIVSIMKELPTVERIVIIPFVGMDISSYINDNSNIVNFNDFIKPHLKREFVYERFAFDHPLFIMFSSGTTGKPKCIVHAAGRILLQHLKEHQLHCDIHAHDRVFYYSTCGWMMWNWHMTALASGATLVLYDGSPFINNGTILLDLCEDERLTLFGTSAKYIHSLEKSNIFPNQLHDFPHLRLITSTGSPLSEEGFEFVYKHFKDDVALASIAGGTDLVGCFVLGNPMGPVHKGEIQTAGLGIHIDVFDEDGSPMTEGKGEMVCTTSFMSKPIKFWNDEQDEKLFATYYSRYPNVWNHGDYIQRTEHGGFIIHGRSDTTLKPGGVRIGTAEIYRQVEKLEEVLESLVVGQDYDQDVRCILFVKLREHVSLTDELIHKIKYKIRENTTPRHVPAKVIAVPDIPKTKSGKITEIAVRDLIHGRKIKNTEAIANPECLDFYRDLVIP